MEEITVEKMVNEKFPDFSIFSKNVDIIFEPETYGYKYPRKEFFCKNEIFAKEHFVGTMSDIKQEIEKAKDLDKDEYWASKREYAEVEAALRTLLKRKLYANYGYKEDSKLCEIIYDKVCESSNFPSDIIREFDYRLAEFENMLSLYSLEKKEK